MDISEHDLSDDGHFLSDTDDEYNEDFEEWDKLGEPRNSQEKQKESELSKLNESELLRLAALNAESAQKAVKDSRATEACNLPKEDGDKELEQNRRAWLAMRKPIIGKRPVKKNTTEEAATKKKKKVKDVQKTKEEVELEKLAFEEIMREAKRGKERAEEMGSSGWQKPKVPPTNKRFLQNTLLSTLPRKRRDEKSKEARNYSRDESDENLDGDYDERINPDVDEKIDEYRKKRSQNYEEVKHHRRQEAEDKKSFNKAVKEAEKEKRRYDNVMRYGVKIGAKREKVPQEKKKAIFDRYHGVWMPLDRTYHRPESNSDDSESSEDEGQRSSGHRTYDETKTLRRGYRNPRGRVYYHQSGDRGRAWQAYYAAAYNYYKYMHEHRSMRNYREHDGNYRQEAGSSADRYYHRHHSDRKYDRHEHKYSDEWDRDNSDTDSFERKRDKKRHKKHKKKKKSKKGQKKSSKSRGHKSKKSEKHKTRNKFESTSQDSESDSELSLVSSSDETLDTGNHKQSRANDKYRNEENESESTASLSNILSDGIYAKILKDDQSSDAKSTCSSDVSAKDDRVKHKHKSKRKKSKHKK